MCCLLVLCIHAVDTWLYIDLFFIIRHLEVIDAMRRQDSDKINHGILSHGIILLYKLWFVFWDNGTITASYL